MDATDKTPIRPVTQPLTEMPASLVDHVSGSRLEDPPLVTGQGRFLDDLDPLPGTLVAAIVRSPHAHAKIRKVDLDRARAHPGVAAVIGPEEVLETLKPFPLSLRTNMPYYPTGTDRVRYVGEPVAVVVATDRYTAEDAAELADVLTDDDDLVVGRHRVVHRRVERLGKGELRGLLGFRGLLGAGGRARGSAAHAASSSKEAR